MAYRGLSDFESDPWLDPRGNRSDWFPDGDDLIPPDLIPTTRPTVDLLGNDYGGRELGTVDTARQTDMYRDGWLTDYAYLNAPRQETYTPPVRRGALRRARVATAIVATAGLALAIGFVTSRHHGETEAKGRTTSPAATAPAHPKRAAPVIFKNGVINLSAAEQQGDAVPAAVAADKLSIAAIFNYSNREQAGMGWRYSVGFGTGYVVKDANGEDELLTAAHVVDGVAQEGVPREPNYAAAANVGGQFEELPINGVQIPASYDTTNTLNNPGSLDMAIARVAGDRWQDGDSNTQDGPNGFEGLPAMSLSQQLPKIGALVFQLGERTGAGNAGTWIRPPESPALADDVIIGYDGGRVIMIPINQTRTLTDWEGDSGSPEIIGAGPNTGKAFGTFIEGEQLTNAQLKADFGVEVAGDAPDQEVHINIATVNSPRAFATVSGTGVQGTPNPGFYP